MDGALVDEYNALYSLTTQCFAVFLAVCIFKQFDNSPVIMSAVGVDIDECAVNNGGCSADAVCTDSEGGFSCECNEGFEGDGFTCTGMLPPMEFFDGDLQLKESRTIMELATQL